jgi:acetyl-CoA carboxylase biotin carboxylase subunit
MASRFSAFARIEKNSQDPLASSPMFRKILIANRGEIALRILSACRELGIKTVAVYSEADRNSLHVRFADEAICIGPPRSSESYLNIPQVISAAEIANVDAIHPGYGFLSENANFAEVCEASHITFIGPAPEAIRLMGEKDKAREAMGAAGLPIIPGSPGVVPDEDSAKRIAAEIGYPIMIKAAEGGGGRGMRIVRDKHELIPMFRTARTEAEQAFGSANVYMEKLIERPRHIEFQVLGDKHGNVIHLGERECSLQRRHQKVLEESPSVAVDAVTRKKIGKQVVDALKKLGYSSAGTVEFLREDSGNLYFIEMNARIQVEHPVTEMVTGVDLVKSQIRVAAGEELTDILKPIEFRGHAIECRINAEDPDTFVPSAGRVTAFRVPGGPGIRVDTACYADCVIPPYYDSLIAKIIAHGDTRGEAIARMNRGLDGFVVEGIKTTIPLHKRILADPDFIAGKFDTHFLDRRVPVEAK